MFEPCLLLVTLHVALFAYRLGGVSGVYACSRHIARPELPLEERARFPPALMAVEILLRTASVLLPVVGLQLAAPRGSVNISTARHTIARILGLIRPTIVWMAYLNLRKPTGSCR